MARQDIIFWDRRDSEENWIRKNPILGPGERGFSLDKGKFKIGDGHTPWLLLKYFAPESPSVVPVSIQDLNSHINAPEPHPAYDSDIPPLTLLFENGLI